MYHYQLLPAVRFSFIRIAPTGTSFHLVLCLAEQRDVPVLSDKSCVQVPDSGLSQF